MTTLRQRLKSEQGFTLIELLVVVIIIGILLAIAVPSYLGFKARAEDNAAQANIRAAVPAAEAYYSDWGNYAFNKKADGSTASTAVIALQSYDAGLKVTGKQSITAKSVSSGASYCISAPGSGTNIFKKSGPSSDIVKGTTAC